MRTLTLALAIVVALAAARPAHADCFDGGGGGDCSGLLAAVVGIGFAFGAEASVAVGGLISMTDGAVETRRGRDGKSARVMNYVFGLLNLAAGVTWSVVGGPALGAGVGVPHLAIGVGDLVVAAISEHRSRSRAVPVVVPVVGSDGAHGSYGGALLAFRF